MFVAITTRRLPPGGKDPLLFRSGEAAEKRKNVDGAEIATLEPFAGLADVAF